MLRIEHNITITPPSTPPAHAISEREVSKERLEIGALECSNPITCDVVRLHSRPKHESYALANTHRRSTDQNACALSSNRHLSH